MKPAPSSIAPLLTVDGLTVDFSGFKALDTFSLVLNEGDIRVVIGPNGAGKSTLCDTIIGRVRATAGKVIYANQDITHLAEHKIVQSGICRKFQAPGILPSLTTEQNLLLAAKTDKRWWKALQTRPDEDAYAKAEALLERIGLTHRRQIEAGLLAHGEKQWLEIAMVVASGAKLLLLDEPTAGMGPAETSQTADLIKSLGQDYTVLVIDHDMAFVEQLQAQITVMHQGKFLFQGDLDAVRNNEEVAAVYLGKEAA